MKLLPFQPSQDFSVGIELEYQIIDPHSCNLISKAKELIRNVQETKYDQIIKPEITQSMLEINSSVHTSPKALLNELKDIQSFLIKQANQLDILFSGAGTHPFTKWVERKIFPTHRYRHFSRRYQYLSKRATVFGLHVHVGCSSKEHALYLTYILSRFVPQLVAMSASSPFYQGVDTGYQSARVIIFNALPLCGTIPYFKDWKQFSAFFNKMKKLEIVGSIKDFYWDIRPKPEFGTVEIRVCDTPLTFQKAIMIAAYIQALACYILLEKPLPILKEENVLYNYNRFQGARYGLEGFFINPYTLKKCKIVDDALDTIERVRRSAEYLGTSEFISELKKEILSKKNDAELLREVFHERQDMKEVVREQCRLWLS